MSDHSPIAKKYLSLSLYAAVAFAFVCMLGMDSAFAQVHAFPNTPDVEITTHTLRAKAQPDECWAYLAGPPPLPMWTDPSQCATYATNPAARPKVNQAYIWGVAESGDSLWFGTVANPQCITSAGVAPSTENPDGAPKAYVTDAWACEFYDSPYYPALYPNARIGDHRSPRIYQYVKSTRQLIDRTPRYPDQFFSSLKNPESIHPLLIIMRGIRAATVYNGLVILAGPNLQPAQGLGFFAWNAADGTFLGGYSILGYNNVRQFLNLNGVLYAGVGTNDGAGKVTGGAILRLNPQIIPGCTYVPSRTLNLGGACFTMNGGTNAAPNPPTVVGALQTVSGTLTSHNGRIFTATWSSTDIPGSEAQLYMSPAIPAGGLTAANANQWTVLWKASDYEPDPFMAQSYAGGAIASFDGYLWWGTLHIPVAPTIYLVNKYPPSNPDEFLQDLVGTYRAGELFRIKDPDTNPAIEMVYANYEQPVYSLPTAEHPAGTWRLKINNMGKKALFGPSGFGNMWNIYIWSAAVWKGRLWFGTMDYGFGSAQGTKMLADIGGVPFPANLYAPTTFGGDFVYFTSANKPAFAESTNGVDNPTSYGIRNQVVSNNGNLFLGVGNAMNRLTDPADPNHYGGLGGWELVELAERTDVNTPVGTNVSVSLPNDTTIRYCSVTKPGITFTKTVNNPFRSRDRFPDLLTPFNLAGPDLPASLSGQPSRVTLLWSSALWGEGCTPTATVTVPYGADVSAPRLLQLQWTGTQYAWKDITTSVDVVSKKVTGTLTKDYLGMLAVAQAQSPRINASIKEKGFDPVKNSYYVDLNISNSSLSFANNITIDQLQFVTLAGTGTVSYNTDLSPATPLAIPNLPPTADAVVRLYLKSTTAFGRNGVLRFSITEKTRFRDFVGNAFNLTMDQTVIP